ncbi:dihydroxyacetone kinase subunit DhaK [Mesorhizobium sp. B3-1-6]|uniref:dihydroxyacetone kinase subunit DhaK n=1 Tax=Mesorhizobium sp. B3-1-6 TaxID=2589895 RepID=UPI00112AE700|nr:dihydroxyacetone kinase subunit DhaK [Mesorhizobium sp. B3-1-6]TPI41341.1 dihydroxyacetone kinase subunit DhaK [Mesorhizobium sp. B3-1-6]
MKKILNDPARYVDEAIEGLVAAYPDIYFQPERRIVTRVGGSTKGKVGIVTGGGSGHLPIFTGYVGQGLLDAAVIGEVFASPPSDRMATAMRLASEGAGVLRLYGNYGGDGMNFDMAGEIVEFEDRIACTTVRVADDIASAPPSEAAKRRGVAGMVYAFKIAGARAEEMADLAEVTRMAQKAADSCRSIGVALTPCIVPQAGKPTFLLADDEIEMGMGIHGEPGIWRAKLKSADELVDEMLDRLLADMPLSRGDQASILVNSLGATPLEELYIMFRRAKSRLADLGVNVIMPLVGRFATSMEMTGATITLASIDGEMERLLKAPCHCAFWSVR